MQCAWGFWKHTFAHSMKGHYKCQEHFFGNGGNLITLSMKVQGKTKISREVEGFRPSVKRGGVDTPLQWLPLAEQKAFDWARFNLNAFYVIERHSNSLPGTCHTELTVEMEREGEVGQRNVDE